MREYTFEEMMTSYWLTRKEVADRVNLVLEERGQKFVMVRGVDQLIDVATGQVIEKVELTKLAKYFDVVKPGEIFRSPPFDMAIKNGKLVGIRNFFRKVH